MGFALFGLPSPLVLGVIAGVLEFVPLAGPLVVAVLAIALALLHSGFGLAFLVFIFLGVLRIVQDYVLYPRIIGEGIHLHPLAVILAILAGAEIAGVAGIFLAIPVIAVITVSYRHWLEHRGHETIAEVLEEAVVNPMDEAIGDIDRPTVSTTADEMARLRPDLLTGRRRAISSAVVLTVGRSIVTDCLVHWVHYCFLQHLHDGFVAPIFSQCL